MGARDWVGGILTLPSYITGEGDEPYRPEMLVWASLDGPVHGVEIGKPGEMIEAAPFHFKRAIGDGERPSTLRVASPELAKVLQHAFRDIRITCAPTPELDELLASLQEFQSRQPSATPTYLDCGVTKEALDRFFPAARKLYESAPWGAWNDPCVVDIPELGIEGGAVSVIGQNGTSFGFIVFDSLDDLDRFAECGMELEEGEQPSVPRHLALTFEPRKALAGSLVAEIKKHGWKIASAKAYPLPLSIDSDAVARGPTPRELAVLEALCLAFVQALLEEPAATSSQRVETSAGPVSVDIRWEEGELDTGWVGLFCQHLEDYRGKDPETMKRADLRAVLFEIFPAKVMCEPEDARAIVAELRMFVTVLDRTDLLAELDNGAIEDLEDALADPANYGMAKSVMMQAAAEGFDVHTEEGLRAFMEHVNGPKPKPKPKEKPRSRSRG